MTLFNKRNLIYLLSGSHLCKMTINYVLREKIFIEHWEILYDKEICREINMFSVVFLFCDISRVYLGIFKDIEHTKNITSVLIYVFC